MDIKIGYYPMLDTALAIRQICSVERFRPFSPVIETIASKITSEEREAINNSTAATREWLNVIERMIELTMDGIVSPEEMLIKALEDPTYLFGREGKEYMVKILSDTWYDYCFVEMSKQIKRINEKTMEFHNIKKNNGVIEYLLSITDRIEGADGNIIKFNIKPEHSVRIEDIEAIIIMPSVFSCRNMAFWYSGNTYLFYIALDSKKMTLEEPSDMLLLKTLAFNDKTRLKLLKLLANSALSVNDIAEKIEVNASTASRHIKVFKDVAFVDIQSQEGNSIYYSLNEKEISNAMKSIYDYIFKGE